MKHYKLLTPGPLTTTDTVKREMLFDHCTWDDDYKEITQNIRAELLALGHCSAEDYTVVLMQGSGTFGVESALTSSVGAGERMLICSNGAYGLRMVDMAKHAGLDFVHYAEPFDCQPSAQRVAEYLAADPAITHVIMVHCETTSGILNNIEAVARVAKAAGKTFLVDAMSSFGGIEIDLPALGIDFLISSANKCIQGVPGFSFILCRRAALEQCRGKARSLSLDLYDQWLGLEDGGKWRYTSPTHTVLAFAKAIEELKAEGGVAARQARYEENNRRLIARLAGLGFAPYVAAEQQSPIITTFLYPAGRVIEFGAFYEYIKARGYAIYPGKLTDADTFRLGNIGEIYPEDVQVIGDIIEDYLKETVQ